MIELEFMRRDLRYIINEEELRISDIEEILDRAIVAEKALDIAIGFFRSVPCSYCPLDGICEDDEQCNFRERVKELAMEKARFFDELQRGINIYARSREI